MRVPLGMERWNFRITNETGDIEVEKTCSIWVELLVGWRQDLHCSPKFG